MRKYSLILLLLTLSCSRISNQVDREEIECGESVDSSSFQLFKLFNNDKKIDSGKGVVVRSEEGRILPALVTSKGCLKVPSKLGQKLIISRPADNEGTILFPDRFAGPAIKPLFLKAYRYKSVSSPCQGIVSTNAARILWPIELQGQDSTAFAYHLQLDQALTISQIGIEDIAAQSVDLSQWPDGTYALDIIVKQLFSQDQLESHFQCSLVLDRKAPLVTLDRELIRLEGDGADFLQAGPGEAVKIQTKGMGSSEQIHACLQPMGEPEAECNYAVVTGGFITAPNRGSWTLRLYAQDAAGNRGENVNRTLEIFDENLVALNRSYVQQANLARQSGSSMLALISSVKAYENMKTLSTPVEYQEVSSSVRKILAESSSFPLEEMSRKQVQNDNTSPLGMIEINGQVRLLQANQGLVEIVETTGHVESSFDLKDILDVPYMRMNYRFCDQSSRLLATSYRAAVIYDQGKLQKIEFPENPSPYVIPEMSQDCRYIQFPLNSQSQLVYAVETGLRSTVSSSRFATLGRWSQDGKEKLIISRFGPPYSILDLSSNEIIDFGGALGIPNIIDIKQSGDGSIAVVTSEKNLHLLNAQGQATNIYPNVQSVETTAVSGEFIAVLTSSTVRIISANDGLVKTDVYMGAANFSYLSANSGFILALSAGGNVLKVLTRAGGQFDEIYNKGDTINTVWISRLGYYQVLSTNYSKLYRFNAGLQPQYRPSYSFAVGLQFSDDGKSLVFKEQQSSQATGFDTVEHNLVQWDLSAEQSQVFPVAGAVNLNANVPYQSGYSALSRDLENYSIGERKYTAAIVQRSRIAIYERDKFQTPLTVLSLRAPGRNPLDNWLYDLAIHPDRHRAAVTSQDGSIYVFDLTTGLIVTSANLTSLNPSGGQFPISVAFDKTGSRLYVTDNFDNLMLLELGATLTLKKVVPDAGKDLQFNPSGDRLAVVGSKTNLSLFSTDLELKKQFDLSAGGFTLGQSVAFSPDGSKVYAGVYPGYWNEIDLVRNSTFKVNFSTAAAAVGNLVVDPQGEKLAFMSGSFVRVMELNVDRMYRSLCTWLKPRLPYVPDLSAEDRKLCSGLTTTADK